MGYRNLFNIVNVYRITAACEKPLHIGSGEEAKGEILLHPVTGEPFIQATGIAGAFRDYSSRYLDNTAEWFGDSNGNDSKDSVRDDFRSHLIFTDGIFKKGNFQLELRSRVKINPITGTTAKDEKGRSGQLLQTEYISSGSIAEFMVYEYCEPGKVKGILELLLKALDCGEILLGGQLSNGCGVMKLKSVERISCDMTTKEGRLLWRRLEDQKGEDRLPAIRKLQLPKSNIRDFFMEISFDRSVLVKGDAIDQDILERETHVRFNEGDRLPDKMPLMDGNQHFIVPGSSYKGVFRNHMKSILEYLKPDSTDAWMKKVFENRACLFFYDTTIENGSINIQVRTHLDKFTGSVMDKALFKEAVGGGNESTAILQIRLMKKGTLLDEQVSALLLMTMRDCAIGAVTVGSGYSVGRGYMNVKKITVKEQDHTLLSYVPSSGNQVSGKFVADCMAALQEVKA